MAGTTPPASAPDELDAFATAHEAAQSTSGDDLDAFVAAHEAAQPATAKTPKPATIFGPALANATQPSLGGQVANAFIAAGKGLYDSTIGPAAALHKAGMDEAHSPESLGGPAAYGWGVLKAAGRGVLGASASQEDQAAAAIERKAYIEGFGHHLVASIPLFGPLVGELAANVGEGIGDPSSNKLAYAAGQAGGLMAPEMAGGALGMVKPLVAPAAGAAGGAISSALERSFIGGMPFKPFRAKQLAAAEAEYAQILKSSEQMRAADLAAAEQGARQKFGTSLVDRADKIDKAQSRFANMHEKLLADTRDQVARVGELHDAADIGQSVGDSIASRKAAAQELYGQVSEVTSGTPTTKIVQQPSTSLLDASGKPASIPIEQPAIEGGVQVPVTGLKRIAQEYDTMLAERGALLDPKKLGDIRSDLKAIIDGPDSVSYQAASGAASDLLDVGRQIDQPFPRLRGKINSAVSSELKRATNEAVAQADPAAGAALNSANSMWAELHKPAVSELLDRVQSGKPETVHKLLVEPSTSIQDLRDIRAVVDPASWRAMVARNLSDMIEDSVRTKTLKNPAVVNAPGRTVRQVGNSLVDGIDALDRSGKLAEMFPQTANTLRQIVKLANENRTIRAADLPRKPKLDRPSIGAIDKADIRESLGDKIKPFSADRSFSSLLIDLVGFGPLGAHMYFHNVTSPGALAQSIGGATAMYAAAKMFTNPKGANLVLRYMKAAANGNMGRAAEIGQQFAFAATHDVRVKNAQVRTAIGGPTDSSQAPALGPADFMKAHPELYGGVTDTNATAPALTPPPKVLP